ncbi:MAG TPA: AMP-binding protein, partial [Thermoanaerobaculia bacterium]|nr:AMP-binding protein [Thermoanaerobaculia bacterium]
AVRHRPVANLVEWALRAFAFGPGDRVLFVTALSFDLSVFDVFGLLAAGGSIHVASRRDLEEPERLVHLLLEEPITFWDSAPAALLQLAPLFPEPAAESRLRLVFFSGDWIPLALPGRVRAAFPGARVVSLGGATEATVWSNVFPVEEIQPHWVSIPYGRPIQNARYHILDGSLLPCPVGVPGDLYIGGGCLSSGYAAAPDLTADRYLPDPFGREAGGRLYRTGDRARFFADGNIEFLGRLDHQVKIRGFRIELGEIEAALCQHEAVREAVVLVREDVPGQRRLVAYVTPRRETAPGDEELRRFCGSRLPDYMVPAAFVALGLFPVTPNGKLDRAALPAPEDDGAGAGRALAAPRTSMEQAVAEVWAAVLGREAVGIHDGFFALGGDSLLAIQLIMRLRERLGVELPLRALFEHPTVADLALAVARARGEGGGGSLRVVTPAPAALHEPFPLTDLQQAYWLGQRADFDFGGMSAHVYQERDFTDLDPARLETAWRRLVERHPMLRAVVLPDGRQRVLPEVPPYAVEVLDLRALGSEAAAAEAATVGRRMADQGPATDAWPLFEVRLSRLDERRWRLHVSLSLLISDALGLNVLQGELRRLYGDPGADLPPLDLTFRDYVLARAGDEGSAAFARDRGYWLERLPSLPPAPELPLRSTARAEEARFIHHGWHLEPEGWRRFRERAARAGVTPTAAVLTAYAQTLAAWSKDPRFTLNVLYFNRLPVHPQVDRVVGNFSSTLPVAVDAGGSASFEERAQRLQERLWQDLEHGRFSGVRVVRELARLHGVSSRPVLPVVFTSDINL